jgi:hypothetical protein
MYSHAALSDFYHVKKLRDLCVAQSSGKGCAGDTAYESGGANTLQRNCVWEFSFKALLCGRGDFTEEGSEDV